MVADLEQVMCCGAVVQEVEIPTACPSAVAHRRNLQEFLVIFSDFPGVIHVNFLLEPGEFPNAIRSCGDLLEPPFQLAVAHIVPLPLSNHAESGLVDVPSVRRENLRYLRDVGVVQFRLEGDAGGRDDDRLERKMIAGAEIEKHKPRRKIGEGLADSGSRVTQCDLPIQHGVQKIVAQSYLRLPFSHASGGKQVTKDMVNYKFPNLRYYRKF